MPELEDFFESDDPGHYIAQAYNYLKEYDSVGKYIMAPLGIGLSGKVREILRLWGNNDWPR